MTRRCPVLLSLFFIISLGAAQAQQQKRVLLDSYFNDEHRKDTSGNMESYHYKWEEKDNNGFSIFGNAFRRHGATLATLYQAPSPENLQQADIYIIVDPDTRKESPDPKYIGPEHVKIISDWVHAGGVLLLMANDSANVELKHFNTLAEKFGIHFNDDLRNHVADDAHIQDGAILVETGSPILRTTKKIFMKDICSLSVTPPAYAALRDRKVPIIAIAHYGKGVVVAVGDPWLYNEYTNGRLPAGYENDKAASELSQFLLWKVPVKK